MNSIKVCHSSDISDPGTVEFEVKLANGTRTAFLVQINGHISAFINSCPHTGIELNWSVNQYLDRESEYIQCALHGALFRPQDGYCVRGPCAGESLQRLSMVLEDGFIVVMYE